MMRELLVKVNNKRVLMRLKELGNVEVISSIFNIYSVSISEKDIKLVESLEGIETVEENDFFEVQR